MTTATTTEREDPQTWLTRYRQELDAQRAARPPIAEWTTLNLIVEIERAITRHSEHHAWDDATSTPPGSEYREAYHELIRRWRDADPTAAEYLDGTRHYLETPHP